MCTKFKKPKMRYYMIIYYNEKQQRLRLIVIYVQWLPENQTPLPREAGQN